MESVLLLCDSLIEYGDWEIDENVVDRYVNDKYQIVPNINLSPIIRNGVKKDLTVGDQ